MNASTTLTCGDASVTVDDLGSRITSLSVGGDELLVAEADQSLLWGCYPMVPWAGRLGGAAFDHQGRRVEVAPTDPPNAIHGVGIRCAWTRIDDRTRTLDLAPHWPLGGSASTTVDLTAEAVALTVGVTAADRSMPASLGWHPCFVRAIGPHEARLDIRPTHMWPRGPDGLPDGSVQPPSPGPWDDCFGGVTDPPELRWGIRRRVRLESATDVWVVYDESPRAICVEPQTAPPDDVHRPVPGVLGPGDTLELTLTIRW